MRGDTLSEIRSICVFRLSAIGDVCHAIAVVQEIQKVKPELAITWVVGKLEATLIRELPGIECVVFDKSKGLKAFKELRHKMKGRHFDVLLQMQLAFRANVASMFIPAKRKIGYAKHRSKELHQCFVNETVSHECGFHVLDGFKDFAYEIGIPSFEPKWTIPLPEAVIQWVDTVSEPTKPLLIVSPAASKAERNWLIERYAQVIDYAFEKGFQVMLTGSPSAMEKKLSKDIVVAAKSPVINLTGETQLIQLMALLKRADIVIAPDSGPAHMAVTQGTAVIGLYAHSNPRRTGPYFNIEDTIDVYTEVACQQYQCEKEDLSWGARLKGESLMSAITVEMVVNKFESLCERLALNREC